MSTKTNISSWASLNVGVQNTLMWIYLIQPNTKSNTDLATTFLLLQSSRVVSLNRHDFGFINYRTSTEMSKYKFAYRLRKIINSVSSSVSNSKGQNGRMSDSQPLNPRSQKSNLKKIKEKKSTNKLRKNDDNCWFFLGPKQKE